MSAWSKKLIPNSSEVLIRWAMSGSVIPEMRIQPSDISDALRSQFASGTFFMWKPFPLNFLHGQIMAQMGSYYPRMEPLLSLRLTQSRTMLEYMNMYSSIVDYTYG